MSMQSARLGLPCLQASQAQKHVTHNEALLRLDALTQLAVAGFSAETPPTAPEAGEIHALGPAPTGAWAGQAGALAYWDGSAWVFLAPRPGWRAWGLAEAELRVFDGTGWVPAAGDHQNLDGAGIGTGWDATNRLAVASPAALFTHQGAGHQLKVNKAASTDTASLLYQTNWSGRAEMGLAGSDDFSIKVSADGGSWTEALRIEAATGAVSLPQTVLPARQDIPVGGRWHMFTDNAWTGFHPNYGAVSENHNWSGGTGAEPAVSWEQYGVFLRQGTVLHRLRGMLRPNNAEVTGCDLRVILASGPLAAGEWDSDAETTHVQVRAENGIAFSHVDWREIDLDLGDHAVAQDGVLLVFIRPVGTLTTTRYLYGPLTLRATLSPED